MFNLLTTRGRRQLILNVRVKGEPSDWHGRPEKGGWGDDLLVCRLGAVYDADWAVGLRRQSEVTDLGYNWRSMTRIGLWVCADSPRSQTSATIGGL